MTKRYEECELGNDKQCKIKDGEFLLTHTFAEKLPNENLYVDRLFCKDGDYNDDLFPPMRSMEGGMTLMFGYLCDNIDHHLSKYTNSERVPYFGHRAGSGIVKEMMAFSIINNNDNYTFKFNIYTQSQLFTSAHSNELIRAILQLWKEGTLEFSEDPYHEVVGISGVKSATKSYLDALDKHYNYLLKGMPNNITVEFNRRDRHPEFTAGW